MTPWREYSDEWHAESEPPIVDLVGPSYKSQSLSTIALLASWGIAMIAIHFSTIASPWIPLAILFISIDAIAMFTLVHTHAARRLGVSGYLLASLWFVTFSIHLFALIAFLMPPMPNF